MTGNASKTPPVPRWHKDRFDGWDRDYERGETAVFAGEWNLRDAVPGEKQTHDGFVFVTGVRGVYVCDSVSDTQFLADRTAVEGVVHDQQMLRAGEVDNWTSRGASIEEATRAAASLTGEMRFDEAFGRKLLIWDTPSGETIVIEPDAHDMYDLGELGWMWLIVPAELCDKVWGDS